MSINIWTYSRQPCSTPVNIKSTQKYNPQKIRYYVWIWFIFCNIVPDNSHALAQGHQCWVCSHAFAVVYGFTKTHNSSPYNFGIRYSDVKMSAMASQITSITILYWTVYMGTDQRKRQSFASLTSVRGILRWPVNSPQKGPAKQKMFPFWWLRHE